MYVKRYVIELNTGTGTTATGRTDQHINARVLQIEYARPTADQLAATSVLTVKTNTTSRTIWSEAAGSADLFRVPRQVVHASDGTAATSALDGNGSPFVVADEQVRASVAGGGTGKAGTIRILVG